MKNLLTLILLFSLSSLLNAQEDYMAAIAEKSCECLDNISKDVRGEMFNMEFGLCIIAAAEPFSEQLMKDYGIDVSMGEKHGEELGRMVGMKMVAECPAMIMTIADRMSEEDFEDDGSEKFVSGEVVRISGDVFTEFTIKDEDGKTLKFYWLTYVDSPVDLPLNYMDLKGKQVQIRYNTMDLFDKRLEEYRSFNILEWINIKN